MAPSCTRSRSVLENPGEPYRPDGATLAGITAAQVLVGRESPEFFREAGAWLAARLGGEVVQTPGAHTPQWSHPEELVRTIRPILRASS